VAIDQETARFRKGSASKKKIEAETGTNGVSKKPIEFSVHFYEIYHNGRQEIQNTKCCGLHAFLFFF
jgi:hypothetical protein